LVVSALVGPALTHATYPAINSKDVPGMDRDTSRFLYEKLRNKDDPDRQELEAWETQYRKDRVPTPMRYRVFVLERIRDWLFRRWLGLR
jgi:hypothetical protein